MDLEAHCNPARQLIPYLMNFSLINSVTGCTSFPWSPLDKEARRLPPLSYRATAAFHPVWIHSWGSLTATKIPLKSLQINGYLASTLSQRELSPPPVLQWLLSPERLPSNRVGETKSQNVVALASTWFVLSLLWAWSSPMYWSILKNGCLAL